MSRRDDGASPLAMGCLRAATPFFVAGAWIAANPLRLSLAAGLVMGQGFFWRSGTVAFVAALVGLMMLWEVARSSGRYRHGLLFALAYFAPLSEWLGVFVGRWTGSPVLFALAWGFVAFGLALPLAAIVPIASRLMKRGHIWAIPLVWIALELFRSYVPVLAFPWGLLAHPLAYDRIGVLLGRIGEYGVGGLLVAFSLAPFWSQRAEPSPSSRRAVLGGRVLVGAVVLVVLASELLPSRGPDLTLGAYGPGIDLAYGPYAEGGIGRTVEVATRISVARSEQDRLNADLMVLPEGLISSHDPGDLPSLAGVGTLLLGGQRHAGGVGRRDAYQTAFAYDGTARQWQSADKTRLVIFGEFVPGRGVIPYPPSFALPGGDLAAASELQMLDVHGRDGRPFRIGPILCFEALFPDIAYRQKLRGAEVLAVMSLDDWFGDTRAPEWLELASRWRAAETGLPLVRVGSLGRTAIIDGRGEVRRSLPWGESGAIAWNPARD